MNASWSPQQREWLTALGLVAHVRAARPPLPDDPLLHALLRAAGREPDADDARRLLRELPSVAGLRGDAEAKRRLWPRLRALRGKSG